MRKLLITVATIAMTLVMSLSSLLGCNLVVTNNERDMKQVVATVQIEASAPIEEIEKKDLIVAYLNYYYQMEQQGSSRSEVFETIIENLVNNRVIVQYAMKEFAGEGATDINWNPEHYLSNGTVDSNDNEQRDAKYSAYKDMNSLIQSYDEDHKDKVSDSYTGTTRTAPTGAAAAEIDGTEKDKYIAHMDATKFGTLNNKSRQKAFSKVINVLKANELLGKGYSSGDITTTEYYKQTIKSYYENLLIQKFQEKIEAEARSEITYAKAAEKYAELYKAQKDADVTTFEASLDSLSASAPLLYSPYNGYGMVYHILLKADEDLLAKVEDLKEEFKTENGTPAYENAVYRARRDALFNGNITAEDQRSSWIEAGYDFDGTKFTGDYTFMGDDALPFKGTALLLNSSEKPADGDYDPDYKAIYHAIDTEVLTLDQLISEINTYVYNGTATAGANGVYTATEVRSDYDKRIKELMFAFSNDDSDSALNTYKGYAIKPEPDYNETETWMLEFAEAGRELIKKDNKTFMVIATDYGYHIMFYSQSYYNSTTVDGEIICKEICNYPTLEDFLNAQYGVNKDATAWAAELDTMFADWNDYEDTDNYLYVLVNNLAANLVSGAYEREENRILKESSKAVKKYPDTYADLVSED